MTREELIEKMIDGYNRDGICDFGDFPKIRKCMAAALDVAVGELLENCSDVEVGPRIENGHQVFDRDAIDRCLLAFRRARYAAAKTDPAVEAVQKLLNGRWQSFGGLNDKGVPISQPTVVITSEIVAEIVAAVRKADAK